MRVTRTAAVGVLTIVLATIAAPALAADAVSIPFVDHGEAACLDDYLRLGTIRPESNALAVDSATPEQVKQFRQHTASTVLLGGRAIDNGDFHVTCRVSLVRRDDSSSPVVLSLKIGTHYYDFRCTPQSVTYAGRMLNAVTYEPAKDSAAMPRKSDATPLLLEIAQADGNVSVSIDGRAVQRCPAVSIGHGDVAIEVAGERAERAIDPSLNPKTTLRIFDFRATGRLSKRSAEERAWRDQVIPEYREVRRIGNAMGYVKDDPRLPRVLLIGDSVSLYYTDPVRSLLAGKANVHRIPDNARTTTHGLEDMRAWLGNQKWDVVHFNFGLHDITRTSPQVYQQNLEQIVRLLEGTGARLVWATTTPVPREATVITPAAVVRFNKLAREVMDRHRVSIDDLYMWMLPHSDQYKLFPGNEHFKPAGSAYLAKSVAASITAALPAAGGRDGGSTAKPDQRQ